MPHGGLSEPHCGVTQERWSRQGPDSGTTSLGAGSTSTLHLTTWILF